MDPILLKSAGLGFFFGLINGGGGAAAVLWTLSKSDKVFFGTWAAAMLYRFFFLFVFAAFVYYKTRLSAAPALLSLVFGQLLCVPFEILWILKRS